MVISLVCCFSSMLCLIIGGLWVCILIFDCWCGCYDYSVEWVLRKVVLFCLSLSVICMWEDVLMLGNVGLCLVSVCSEVFIVFWLVVFSM